MRSLQLVALFSISCVLSIAACATDPEDYPSLDDPEVQSSAEAVSSVEDESVDVDQDGNDPAAAPATEVDEDSLAFCPPPGSWRDSCFDASCDGTVLCATCITGSGGANFDCRDVAPCVAVSNCFGHLCC